MQQEKIPVSLYGFHRKKVVFSIARKHTKNTFPLQDSPDMANVH
jgi:hypothetical protein